MRARRLPVFRKLHRWIGLVVALPLLIEGVSGSCLVAVDALADLRTPMLTAPVPAGPAQEGDAAAIIAAVADAGGPGLVLTTFAPATGVTPARVEFARPGERGAAVRLWIDPGSHAVLAREAGTGAGARWMRGLHENLFLPFGRALLGWAGVGVLAMAATGVLLWWPPPGRRLAAFGVSRRARGTRLMRELHGAVAIWLFIPLLFQCLSAVPLGFPATARAMAGLAPMRFGAGGRGEMTPPLDVPAVLARVHAAMPDATLADLHLPNAPGRPVFARMHLNGAMPGAPAAFVSVTPDGSRVIAAENPARSTGSWLLGWNRVLHGTEAGGPVWHALQFLAGIALPLLAVTGAWIWAVRRLRRTRQRRLALAAE